MTDELVEKLIDDGLEASFNRLTEHPIMYPNWTREPTDEEIAAAKSQLRPAIRKTMQLKVDHNSGWYPGEDKVNRIYRSDEYKKLRRQEGDLKSKIDELNIFIEALEKT